MVGVAFLPFWHHAAPAGDGSKQCELRARTSCTNFAIQFQVSLVKQRIDAKRPTWQLAQAGRVIPLRDPGLWSHSRECVLDSRILHRCCAPAVRSRTCRSCFRHRRRRSARAHASPMMAPSGALQSPTCRRVPNCRGRRNRGEVNAVMRSWVVLRLRWMCCKRQIAPPMVCPERTALRGWLSVCA